jgi:hypothetical protein
MMKYFMNLVNRDKALITHVSKLESYKLSFRVDVHGKLTSQRSLLTKSKGKGRRSSGPDKSPCGSCVPDEIRLGS